MQISFNESRVFFSQTKHLSPFYRQLSELVQLLVFPLFYFLFSSIFFFLAFNELFMKREHRAATMK